MDIFPFLIPVYSVIEGCLLVSDNTMPVCCYMVPHDNNISCTSRKHTFKKKKLNIKEYLMIVFLRTQKTVQQLWTPSCGNFIKKRGN